MTVKSDIRNTESRIQGKEKANPSSCGSVGSSIRKLAEEANIRRVNGPARRCVQKSAIFVTRGV
jgi:hypothetical protein